MVRILLVDDSQTACDLLAARLVERGYEVTQATNGVKAAELAQAAPPDYVLTDLWMPGISGVQLCRLLRAEPRTAHVPVVLVTAESQRRSRFWARSAGAAAYVAKNDAAGLFETLETLETLVRTRPPVPPMSEHPASRTPIEHRLFERLDAALFESTVAGEVRALAHAEAEMKSVFSGLVDLASEVASYRWLALHAASSRRLFVHAPAAHRGQCEAEARAALGLPAGYETESQFDDRAIAGRPSPPIIAEVRAGDTLMGEIALGPVERGASREDRELMSIVASELGGPLRIVSLVEKARQLAMSDPLTGLLNRRAFLESIQRWLAHFDRYSQPLSLMLLDVDHFKKVNDTYGHDGGDAVLRAIADALPAATRQTDVVARWGGEELVIGLPHTNGLGARVAAERVRRAIAGLVVALPDGRSASVTASVGIACAVVGQSIDALISRADEAMYLAKSRGRNRVELHESDAVPREPSTSEPPQRSGQDLRKPLLRGGA